MPHRPLVGLVACGACWEKAIRADERVVAEHGLPRDLAVDPYFVDEVAVRRACAGDGSVELTRFERLEAVTRLYAEGLSRGEVAGRLGMTWRDVPEPPASLAQASVGEVEGPRPRGVGSGWTPGSLGRAA